MPVDDILFTIKARNETSPAFDAMVADTDRAGEGFANLATESHAAFQRILQDIRSLAGGLEGVGAESRRTFGGIAEVVGQSGASIGVQTRNYRELKTQVDANQGALEELTAAELTAARVRRGNADDSDIASYIALREQVRGTSEEFMINELAARGVRRQLDNSQQAVEDFTRSQQRQVPVVAGVRDAYQDTAAGLALLERHFDRTTPAQQRSVAAWRASEAGIEGANEERERGIRFARQLTDQLDESDAGIQRETRRLLRNAEARRVVNEATSTSTRRLRGVLATLQTLGGFRGAGLALERVTTDFDAATTAGGKLRALLPLIGGAFGGLSHEIQQFLRRGIRETIVGSAQLESGMVRLETQIGLTRSETRGLREDVEDLAEATGRNAASLADSAFFIQSGGQRGASANAILEASAKSAAIALGTERDVAQLLTSALNAYGEENLSAHRAAEILLSTVREGALDANELSSSLGKTLAPAAELGVELDELGAIVAFYTRFGVSAAESTTAFRSVLEGILKPSEQARDILGDIGISVEELQEFVGEHGLTATLQLLRRELGNDITALTGFLGRQEAVGLVLALTGERADQANQIISNLAEDTDNLDAAFLRVSETTEFKWNQTLASMRDIGYEIGDRVLPIINTGLDTLIGLFQGGDPAAAAREYVSEWERLYGLKITPGVYSAEEAFIDLLAARGGDAAENLRGVAEAFERVLEAGKGRAGEDAQAALIETINRGLEDSLDLRPNIDAATADYQQAVADYEAVLQILEDESRQLAPFEFRDAIFELRAAEAEVGDLVRKIEVLEDQTEDARGVVASLGVTLKSVGEREVALFQEELRELGLEEASVSELTRAWIEELRRLNRVSADVGTELFATGDIFSRARQLINGATISIEDLQGASDALSLSAMRREIALGAATAAVLALRLGDAFGSLEAFAQGRLELRTLEGSDAGLIEQYTNALLNVGSAQEGVDRESRAAAGSQNTLNAEIEEAIQLLAAQQGILASTLREYNDFWTDARRASERAIEDQAAALQRLERDAFKGLEGIQGERRQLLELQLRQRLDAEKDALDNARRQEERFYEDRIEAARDVQDRIRDAQGPQGGGGGGGVSGGGAGLSISTSDIDLAGRDGDGDAEFDFRLRPRIEGLPVDQQDIYDELASLWGDADETVAQGARNLAELVATFGVRSDPEARTAGQNLRTYLTLRSLWTSSDTTVARLARELAEIVATFSVMADVQPNTAASEESATQSYGSVFQSVDDTIDDLALAQPAIAAMLGVEAAVEARTARLNRVTLTALQSLWTSGDATVARLAREFAEYVAMFGVVGAVEPNVTASEESATQAYGSVFQAVDSTIGDLALAQPAIAAMVGVEGDPEPDFVVTKQYTQGAFTEVYNAVTAELTRLAAVKNEDDNKIKILLEFESQVDNPSPRHEESRANARRAFASVFDAVEDELQREARGANLMRLELPFEVDPLGGFDAGGGRPVTPGASLIGTGRAQRGPIEVRVVNAPEPDRRVSSPAPDDVTADWRRQQSRIQRGSRSWVVAS